MSQKNMSPEKGKQAQEQKSAAMKPKPGATKPATPPKSMPPKPGEPSKR